MDVLERARAAGGFPVDGEFVKLHSCISREAGAFLQDIIADVRPRTYVEVGLAFGFSAVYAGRALKALGRDYTHHIIDPDQNTSGWKGIGLGNLTEEGLADSVVFHEVGSEFALPALLRAGETADMGFIDGWHTFDQTMVDFYYLNRMLAPGGVIVFDDADWPAVSKAVGYALSYPCYEICGVSQRTAGKSVPEEIAGASAVAIRKIAKDERRWDWFEGV